MQPKLARCKLPFSANAANDRDRKGKGIEKWSPIASHTMPVFSAPCRSAQRRRSQQVFSYPKNLDNCYRRKKV